MRTTPYNRAAGIGDATKPVKENKEVRYGSSINIRPGQNNPAMEILDSAIRDRVDVIVRSFFEGV